MDKIYSKIEPTKLLHIIHRLSELPWTTQRELSNETSLTIAEMMTLNSFIRESEELQHIILHEP